MPVGGFDARIEKRAQRIDLELVIDGRPVARRQEDLEDIFLPEGIVPLRERRDDAAVPPVEANQEGASAGSDANRRRQTRRASVEGICQPHGRQADQPICRPEPRDIPGRQREFSRPITRSHDHPDSSTFPVAVLRKRRPAPRARPAPARAPGAL